MTDANIKPFTWKGHPRYEFRDWARDQFPELAVYKYRKEDYVALRDRLPEVHRAAMLVLDKVMRFSNSALQNYYAQDLTKLRTAFEAGDVKAYARHLDEFLEGISLE